MQWCAGIGNFYRYAHPLIKMNKIPWFKIDFYEFFLFSVSENLLLHGDTETNPGPNKKI